MQTVPTDFMTSLLALHKPAGTDVSVSVASLIYDSRNAFAARAVTEGYDRVLFIDSDMVFPPDTLTRLAADMDENNLDYVSGLFFNRQMPVKPMLYDRLEIVHDENGIPKAETHTFTDYPRDSLFTVRGTGLGCVLISTRLIRSVWDQFGPPYMPLTTLGEDLAFCLRVNQIGGIMHCDSFVKVGHIGTTIYNEDLFMQSRNSNTEVHN